MLVAAILSMVGAAEAADDVITITVVNRAGEPIPGAEVSLQFAGDWHGDACVAAMRSGTTAWHEAPARRPRRPDLCLILAARAPGHSEVQQGPYRPGTMPDRITLPEGVRVTGTVVGPREEGEWRVLFSRPARGTSPQVIAKTESDGSFAVHELSVGTWWVRLWGPQGILGLHAPLRVHIEANGPALEVDVDEMRRRERP